MKFAYSKLSAAMLMALGLTACGGGGGDSGSGGDNPSVTTKVTQNIRYDIGEDSVVTQSADASVTNAKVKVCLDINSNNKCDLGEYNSYDNLSGVATLTFTEDEFANKKILVVQESKGISYEVDANLASKDSDGNRKSLYVNAITNLGSVLGQEKATKILGESAKLLLDPTIAPADTEEAQILQEAIEQLGLTNNAEISNNVVTVEQKLQNAYSNISSALDNGNDKEDILGHIRNNGTVEKLPSLEPPISNNKPFAKFEVSSNDAGRVTFKNLSTDADGDKLTYDWNFGDGTTSKETDPSHTYAKNGNYEVLLHVNDGMNFTTFRFTLTVTGVIDNNHAPTVSFSTVKTGLTVQFKNASTDADGDTLVYVWDFGDGSTSSVKNPVHTYTKAGSYSVILKVTDGKSDAKELTQTITVADVEVANKAPVADFDYQASQLAVTFTNKSSDADGDKLTYAWDFGDGTSSTEQSPKHTYTKDGIYKVVLTVSDGKDTKAKTTTIEVFETENVNHAPKAQFTAVVSGNKVTFTNTSTDVDDDELSYVWDFGDGFTSKDKVPEPHIYAQDSEYTITLTVSDGKLKDENKHKVKIGKVVENQWASATGDKASKIFVDDGTESACKLPAGSVAIKADVAEAPTVYAYTKDEATITAKWPGDTTKKIEDCTSAFWQLSGLKDSDLYIVSNAGGKRYPAENKPGVTFSSETPCFDFASKKVLSAEECGISSEVGADKVYAQRGTSKLENGSVITISAKDDAPESEYVDLGFMLYGKGVKADTTGSYVIDGEEYPFTNGDIIRVGEKVTAADTAAGEEPAQIKITLKYNDVSVNYTVKKVKWQKPVAKNDFSWNNILVYFVMTDRFENGDTSNDHSYGRPYKDSAGTAGATFHGGDIVGMTKRLDYIKSLGMNAIWITAPYEQSHGWTGGGSSGSFAHYAYHGYYALDFTSLDANIGTVDEFRTFVTEAHKRGIRVVLDIVMNHSGYATLKDMCDFGFGVRSDGKSACEEWTPGAGQSFHNKPIGESKDSRWDAWWGKSWIISGGYGEQCGCGDGLDACISFLPDFKNSDPTGPQVSIPAFLSKKWSSPDADHDIPAAMKYRSGSMSVAQFQARWLASWVEEFGIDGFRCDTAKHVAKPSWKLLKEYSNEALNKWREANKGGADPAAEWKDNFWMTGEHWGYKTDPSDGGGYASSGGFDSMINFSFNGQANGGGCGTPTINSWKDYAGMYGVGSGSPKLNALTYVSSHDTSLCRPGNMKDLGTYLELLPGGVQVYYGDETARKNDNGGASNDREHGTRSDMNFPSDISSQAEWAADVDTLSTKFSSDPTLAHWQKVGQFRFRNVAVGAGKQEEIDSKTFCRTYKDEGTGIDNAVVIHVGADSTVNVGACFDDNTELQDAYSGATVTVSGGQVTIPAPGELVLLELKRN